MAYTYRVATENLFKILVIHTNLNCYAEYPPPLQGAQRPQRADSVRRVCGGVADTHAGI